MKIRKTSLLRFKNGIMNKLAHWHISTNASFVLTDHPLGNFLLPEYTCFLLSARNCLTKIDKGNPNINVNLTVYWPGFPLGGGGGG